MGLFRRVKDRLPTTRRIRAALSVFSCLRVRLLALVLLAGSPALVLIFYTDLAWRRHDVRDTNRYALGLVRLVAAHQEQVVQGAQNLLISVAQAPAVRHNDPAGCPAILVALRRSFPNYANLGVIRADGHVSCSAVPVPASASLGDRPFFRRVLETRGFVAGDFMVERISGRSTMHFAAPVFDETDSIQAVVFAGLNLDELSRHLTLAELPRGATVTLMDQAGGILARAPEAERWVGRTGSNVPMVQTIVTTQREGTAMTEDLDGVRKLIAYTPLHGPFSSGGLYVAVAIPLAAAFADVNHMLARNLAGLGGAGVAILLLAWFGADLVVLRRVRAMIGMTQRLIAGDLSARSGVAQGSGELCQLAAAFDTMAAELEARLVQTKHSEEALRRANDELEKRVQERTAHLVVANESQQVALRDLKRAEDHLSEQQAQLAGIIDSAMEAMIIVDENDLVILFNRAAERVFRLPAAEAIGRPVERFIPERFRAAHRAGLRRLHQDGAVGDRIGVTGSAFAARADGEEFPIEAAISRTEIRGEALYTVILRDLSEQLKTEDMLRKLSRAVEQTAESVFITNPDGRIEYVNPAFESLTGYGREEAIGRTPSILKSGEHDAAFYRAMWTALRAGQSFNSVFLNQRKSGERYYEDQTITPIRDERGNITHFVSSGRDVTHRKRTEEALRRLNAQLEREAERIAHALHDEAGQLLTSAHITLADVARDLPEAERDRVSGVREHLHDIEQQLRRLSHELRPRILDDLGLDAALEFLADGFMKRTGIAVTIEVALDTRLPLIAETTLYRVIQEALTNAGKHARPKRIRVQVACNGKAVRCAVRDDGAGFDVAAALARRGEPNLGLVGTRDRVEALGGTLGVASIPGEGTELVVLIPVEPAEG